MLNVLWRLSVISLFFSLGSFNYNSDLKLNILGLKKDQKSIGIEEKNQYFELNRTSVTAFWHNVLMRGFIKAKLNREKTHLSRLDAALADICLDEAKTLIERIQCLENVLQKRDSSNALFKDLCAGVKDVIEDVEKPQQSSKPMNFFQKIKMKFRKFFHRPSKTLQMHRIQGKFLPKSQPIRVKKVKRLRRKRRKHRKLEAHLSRLISHHYKTHRKTVTREKREITAAELKKLPETYENFGTDVFEMIAEIDDHERRVETVNSFWKMVTKENSQLIHSIDKNIEMVAPKMTSKRRLLDSALSKIGKFTKKPSSGGHKGKFQTASVLSPRFFSFSNQEYSDILSPRIFGLRPGGILSLNDLGRAKGAINLSMAKFLVEVSGAGKAIRHIYADMAPEIKQVRDEVYPDMIELATHTLNWVKARKLMSARQRCEMKNYGYTHMTPQQIQLVYNKKNKFSQELPFDLSEYGRLDAEGRERRVEYLLSNMLYMGKNLNETETEIDEGFVQENDDNSTGPIPPNPIQIRQKRSSPEEGPPGFTNRTNGILFEVLRPYAFDVLTGLDAYLEVLVLSPSAFTLEIFQPELLLLGLLSPRAFAAVVLSPGALIARILSPMAFKFEVLSPRALTTWVLAPEGFVADVLTPTFLEPRVLSPIGAFVSILSPNVLGPHIGGTDHLGVTVLSPNILSPRIAQRERLMIEILSPHILGGEHLHAHHRGGHEPEEENDEPAAGGHTAIEMVDLHGLAHDVDEDDPITLEKILGAGEEWAEAEIMPDDRHLMEFLRIPIPPSQAVAHSAHLAAEAAAGAEHTGHAH